MLWAAALVLAAADLLGAGELGALGDSDDARAVVFLESALESRLDELKNFPNSLAPPDLEEEIVAAMLSLERLDRERALWWARTVVNARPTEAAEPIESSSLVARRVLARSGDRSVIALALKDYFREPGVWHEILGDAAAATHDVRLRDFGDLADRRAEPSPALVRFRLRAARGETMVPLSSASFEPLLDEDFLAIQRALLALPPRSRYRAIRFLAVQDHASLVGLPMTSDTIERLYPYFAISRHPELRARVRRAQLVRGHALASLLLSPRADREEKRAHAEAMRDAWFDAMVALGRDVLTPIVGNAALIREIGESSASAGMVYVRSPAARARLERAETPEAIRWLGERSDAAISVAWLTALRTSAEPDVRRAAEIELLRMGAPGSSAFLRSQLEADSLEALLPAAVESATDAGVVRRAIERVGRRRGEQPVALVAMLRFHERHPREFLKWLDADDVELRERARFVMAMSGDTRRLPLLTELAVTARGPSRDAALRGLSEMNLDHFAPRLHRLAGDPDRSVRFQTALALVPTGEEWALRLLMAELDAENSAQRLRARRAIERLPGDDARTLLERLISNATASPFAVSLYLDLASERDVARWDETLWRALAPLVDEDDPTALLAAARLSHPEARAAVARYLDGR